MEMLIPKLIQRFCIGNGIEIGPGKNPYCNRSNTKYLDKFMDNKDGTLNPDIVSDSADIPVEKETFDFLVSSHSLEHHQNTLKVLYEWKRVLKKNGIMFLVLPHFSRTFDRYRSLTTLQHHIDDYNILTDEDDTSHYEEMKDGWSKQPNFEHEKRVFEAEWGIDVWDWKGRVRNGVIHYHVWSQNELVDLFRYIDLKIEYVVDWVPERDDSFVIIGRKL